MLKKTEAMVLRSRDYGEAHKILTLLTPQGKVAVMARGARRARSRLGAVSQPLIFGHFVYYIRGSGGSEDSMGTLNQGEVIHSYYQMASDLHLQAYAMYFLECADQVAEVYSLLINVLNMLEAGKPPAVLRLVFDLALLDLAGCRPVWEYCIQCGARADVAPDASAAAPWFVSPAMGGLLCTACCKAQERRVTPASPETIRLLRFLQDFPVGRMGEVKLSRETVERLERIVSSFTAEHLSLRLKSLSFLEQMQSWEQS